MAIDVSQLVDYSWCDIAKAAKQAMLSAALGGATYSINGRNFGRITIEQAQSLYSYALQMDNAQKAGDMANGVLVQFNEPQ